MLATSPLTYRTNYHCENAIFIRLCSVRSSSLAPLTVAAAAAAAAGYLVADCSSGPLSVAAEAIRTRAVMFTVQFSPTNERQIEMKIAAS